MGWVGLLCSGGGTTLCTVLYLYGGFAGDVGHQEVHGDILTVHMSIHPVLDVSWHLVSVQVVEVLERKEASVTQHQNQQAVETTSR